MVGIQNQQSVLIFTDAGGEGSVGFYIASQLWAKCRRKFFFQKAFEIYIRAVQLNTIPKMLLDATNVLGNYLRGKTRTILKTSKKFSSVIE